MEYTLYYFIPWPDSQKWLDCKEQIEDGDIVPVDNNVFVAKDLYEYVNFD